MITLLISSILSISFSQANPRCDISLMLKYDKALCSEFDLTYASEEDKKDSNWKACARKCSDLKATSDNTKTAKTEVDEECKEHRKTVNEACGLLKLSYSACSKKMQDCANKKGRTREKACADIYSKISKESAEDALDSAKDDFENSESKLQDLQEKLTEAQENALESQQSTEKKISELQEKLTQVPLKAQEIALKNEGERDKTLLNHIDNLNKVTDELQNLTDAFHDAETQLTNKRNELLTQCELEARGKQQAKIAEKNQKKAVGKYTMASLSEAIQTSYQATQGGKKVLRNTKEIVQRFERCQKTRLHQTGLQAAERNYQRTLIALESKRKSIEKQHKSMEARLEASLKMNNKASELEMAQLVQEQAAMQNQVIMLQKQLFSNQQQAQSNIAQIQQNIQKAQFDQAQKQQSMFSAISMSNMSKQQGSLSDDDVKSIRNAVSIFGENAGEDEDSIYKSEHAYCSSSWKIEEIKSRSEKAGQ